MNNPSTKKNPALTGSPQQALGDDGAALNESTHTSPARSSPPPSPITPANGNTSDIMEVDKHNKPNNDNTWGRLIACDPATNHSIDLRHERAVVSVAPPDLVHIAENSPPSHCVVAVLECQQNPHWTHPLAFLKNAHHPPAITINKAPIPSSDAVPLLDGDELSILVTPTFCATFTVHLLATKLRGGKNSPADPTQVKIAGAVQGAENFAANSNFLPSAQANPVEEWLDTQNSPSITPPPPQQIAGAGENQPIQIAPLRRKGRTMALGRLPDTRRDFQVLSPCSQPPLSTTSPLTQQKTPSDILHRNLPSAAINDSTSNRLSSKSSGLSRHFGQPLQVTPAQAASALISYKRKMDSLLHVTVTTLQNISQADTADPPGTSAKNSQAKNTNTTTTTTNNNSNNTSNSNNSNSNNKDAANDDNLTQSNTSHNSELRFKRPVDGLFSQRLHASTTARPTLPKLHTLPEYNPYLMDQDRSPTSLFKPSEEQDHKKRKAPKNKNKPTSKKPTPPTHDELVQSMLQSIVSPKSHNNNNNNNNNSNNSNTSTTQMQQQQSEGVRGEPDYVSNELLCSVLEATFVALSAPQSVRAKAHDMGLLSSRFRLCGPLGTELHQERILQHISATHNAHLLLIAPPCPIESTATKSQSENNSTISNARRDLIHQIAIHGLVGGDSLQSGGLQKRSRISRSMLGGVGGFGARETSKKRQSGGDAGRFLFPSISPNSVQQKSNKRSNDNRVDAQQQFKEGDLVAFVPTPQVGNSTQTTALPTSPQESPIHVPRIRHITFPILPKASTATTAEAAEPDPSAPNHVNNATNTEQEPISLEELLVRAQQLKEQCAEKLRTKDWEGLGTCLNSLMSVPVESTQLKHFLQTGVVTLVDEIAFHSDSVPKHIVDICASALLKWRVLFVSGFGDEQQKSQGQHLDSSGRDTPEELRNQLADTRKQLAVENDSAHKAAEQALQQKLSLVRVSEPLTPAAPCFVASQQTAQTTQTAHTPQPPASDAMAIESDSAQPNIDEQRQTPTLTFTPPPLQFGAIGRVVVAFGASNKVGVSFNEPYEGGVDLGGLCPPKHGFVLHTRQLVHAARSAKSGPRSALNRDASNENSASSEGENHDTSTVERENNSLDDDEEEADSDVELVDVLFDAVEKFFAKSAQTTGSDSGEDAQPCLVVGLRGIKSFAPTQSHRAAKRFLERSVALERQQFQQPQPATQHTTNTESQPIASSSTAAQGPATPEKTSTSTAATTLKHPARVIFVCLTTSPAPAATTGGSGVSESTAATSNAASGGVGALGANGGMGLFGASASGGLFGQSSSSSAAAALLGLGGLFRHERSGLSSGGAAPTTPVLSGVDTGLFYHHGNDHHSKHHHTGGSHGLSLFRVAPHSPDYDDSWDESLRIRGLTPRSTLTVADLFPVAFVINTPHPGHTKHDQWHKMVQRDAKELRRAINAARFHAALSTANIHLVGTPVPSPTLTWPASLNSIQTPVPEHSLFSSPLLAAHLYSAEAVDTVIQLAVSHELSQPAQSNKRTHDEISTEQPTPMETNQVLPVADSEAEPTSADDNESHPRKRQRTNARPSSTTDETSAQVQPPPAPSVQNTTETTAPTNEGEQPNAPKSPPFLLQRSSIQHALKTHERLWILQGRPKTAATKLQSFVTDNEFEKKLLADVIPPNEIGVRLDDIGALEDVKKTIHELVMLPLQRPALFRRGILTKPCKGILLFGPPGTGKTMLAKAVATEAGANFISVTMSSISSKWFGEAERYVRALFSLASRIAPAVIFVDEIDSMLGKRGSNNEHEAMRKVKNEFMSLWDGLRTKQGERVLVMGATNRPFDLDDAVLRRMPRRLLVDLPDAEQREKILRVVLAKEELEPGFDYAELAKLTAGFSGSDLRHLCTAAAFIPIREAIAHDPDAGRSRSKKHHPTNHHHHENSHTPKTTRRWESTWLNHNTDNSNDNDCDDDDDDEACDSDDDTGKNEVPLRQLCLKDFTEALKEVKGSLTEDSYSVQEIRKWNEMMNNSKGHDKSLTYFM